MGGQTEVNKNTHFGHNKPNQESKDDREKKR